jgi:hypothetical protein
MNSKLVLIAAICLAIAVIQTTWAAQLPAEAVHADVCQ